MNFQSIIKVILNLFAEPSFDTGARVNRVSKGALDRTDGRVVAQTEKGVLVEWPRNGAHWEMPHQLCQQIS
jgi:hypothetical protein